MIHQPYNIKLMVEGLEPELPEAIEESYYRFLNRIQGSPELSSESVLEVGRYTPGVAEEVIDGVRYEWVKFED